MQPPPPPNSPADEPWVTRQFLERLGRGPKQNVIDRLLVRARHRPQLGRQREGDHKMNDRQQQTLLSLEPSVGLVILALGAVAILTRVIAVAILLTLITVIDLSAQLLGAAPLDVP